MPRSSVLLTPAPPDARAVAAAAGAVWRILAADQPGVDEFTLLPIEDGAALQVRGADNDLVVTVLRPLVLHTSDEVARLLPGVATDPLPLPVVWTPALTPWTAGGLIGIAILDRLAADAAGRVSHRA